MDCHFVVRTTFLFTQSILENPSDPTMFINSLIQPFTPTPSCMFEQLLRAQSFQEKWESFNNIRINSEEEQIRKSFGAAKNHISLYTTYPWQPHLIQWSSSTQSFNNPSPPRLHVCLSNYFGRKGSRKSERVSTIRIATGIRRVMLVEEQWSSMIPHSSSRKAGRT